MSKRTFDNFDEFAKDYRQIHNENIKVSGVDSDFFSEYKIIEIKNNELNNKKVTKILDLGCGDGNGTRFFRNHFPKAEIYGVDVSKDSIEVAKSRNIRNSKFVSYDGSVLPFEGETFDIILIACVMHHIDINYHKSVINEALRVLKKNSNLYIFEHNPYNPVTRKVVSDCVFDEDAVLLNPQYTKRLVKNVGFKTAKTKFTIFFPRKGLFRKVIFLEKYLAKVPLGGQYYVAATK
ncbi:class I SAM-dependent methyltransferase [Paenibacillus foliorum]|nr:class I SAM-dependent methyltransferase [Paenibacillus foliorum]